MIQKTIEYIKIPKRLLWISLAVLSVISLLWAFRPKKIEVDVGKISQGIFTKAVTDEGFSQFHTKVVLGAPADGILESHSTRAGDPVKKNQILASFIWDFNAKIRAPFDGYVLKVFEKDRRHLARGTPLFEVGSPDRVEIIARILSEEVSQIRVGQKAWISKWGGDQPLEAVVSKIEAAAKEEISTLGVKEKRVDVYLDLRTDRKVWASLGDGFRLEVSIVIRETPQATLLPLGALVTSNGKPAVFLVEGGRAKLTEIEVGDRNRDWIELTRSIPVGSPVVLYPGSGLKDQAAVRIRRTLE